jgi:hypothetical protein
MTKKAVIYAICAEKLKKASKIREESLSQSVDVLN